VTKTLPILLGISRNAGTNTAPGNDAGVQQIKTKVFERDDYTCRFCGFQSNKYQEVRHLNNNYADFTLENLATACIFCHQCFTLERVSQMQSGFLIWLPEIPQANLHHICRAMYVARRTQGPLADAARSAIGALTARREQAEKRLGTDKTAVLAAIMQDLLDRRDYQQRARKLDGIRLFPVDKRIITDEDLEFDQFPQILAYWRSRNGPYGGLLPPSWSQLYKTLPAAA
jgi:intracellular multiplication protein IcmJ